MDYSVNEEEPQLASSSPLFPPSTPRSPRPTKFAHAQSLEATISPKGDVISDSANPTLQHSHQCSARDAASTSVAPRLATTKTLAEESPGIRRRIVGGKRRRIVGGFVADSDDSDDPDSGSNTPAADTITPPKVSSHSHFPFLRAAFHIILGVPPLAHCKNPFNAGLALRGLRCQFAVAEYQSGMCSFWRLKPCVYTSSTS